MTRVELTDDDPLGLGPLGGDSGPKELDDWRWKGLSFEQEIYLKKLIIKHALDRELDVFAGTYQTHTLAAS